MQNQKVDNTEGSSESTNTKGNTMKVEKSMVTEKEVKRQEILNLANKLYNRIYPKSSMVNMGQTTDTYQGFFNLAKDILDGKYNH